MKTGSHDRLGANMGHVRLWRLPGSQKWQQVVALLDGDAGLETIAASSADAAEHDLSSAADDEGLVHAFWLLTQLPIAAGRPDFREHLQGIGIETSSEPSLLELTSAFSRAIDRHLSTRGRTDLAEMAQHAAVESLTTLVAQDLPGLFSSTSHDLQAALRRLRNSDRFSVLARDFFSRVVRKSLGYFLSRELSNHVGRGERFQTIQEHAAFNEALDFHCREASRIIKEFAGGWYGKRLFLRKEITPDGAAAFAHIAFRKLRSELRRKRDADG
jgi:hypothetical protein